MEPRAPAHDSGTSDSGSAPPSPKKKAAPKPNAAPAAAPIRLWLCHGQAPLLPSATLDHAKVLGGECASVNVKICCEGCGADRREVLDWLRCPNCGMAHGHRGADLGGWREEEGEIVGYEFLHRNIVFFK